MKKIWINTILAISCATSVAFAGTQAINTANQSPIKVQIIQTQVEWTKQSFKSAQLEKSDQEGYQAIVELTPQATKQMQQLTANNIHRVMNLVLNKQIISSATIQSTLGGKFRITGLTYQQAKAFVDLAKS